jgi:hypothetical protein
MGSAIGFFSVSYGDDLCSLVHIVNDVKYTIIADSHSHSFATIEFLGVAGEGIAFQ